MKAEERFEDHLLERDLEEILGEDTPPSIADRVLERLGPDTPATPRRTPWPRMGWLAAAGVLIATVSTVSLLSNRHDGAAPAEIAFESSADDAESSAPEADPLPPLIGAPGSLQEGDPHPPRSGSFGGLSGGTPPTIHDAGEIDRLPPDSTSISVRNLSDEQIQRLLDRLPRLSNLTLIDCPEMSDRSLEALSQVPTLQRIRLKNCPGISDEAISNLLATQPGLAIERLDPPGD